MSTASPTTTTTKRRIHQITNSNGSSSRRVDCTGAITEDGPNTRSIVTPSSISRQDGTQLPTLSWDQIELIGSTKKNTSSTKLPALILKGRIKGAPTIYHIKRHHHQHHHRAASNSKTAATALHQEAKLLSQLYHPRYQMLKVHAIGHDNDFLVMDYWEETLQQRIVRLKYDYTLHGVLCEIGLPIIQTLRYLHFKHERSYNILSMNTVGFLSSMRGGGGGGSRLVLTDFSKTAVAKKDIVVGSGGGGEVYYCDYESFDVYCWGKLLREVLDFLRLLGSHNTELATVLDLCCHSQPTLRPSLQRLLKRLLELKASTASSNPAGTRIYKKSRKMIDGFKQRMWACCLGKQQQLGSKNSSSSMDQEQAAASSESTVEDQSESSHGALGGTATRPAVVQQQS